MRAGRVRASLIVRVVDAGGHRRIVVHDLRSREVVSFAAWAEALRYLRRVGEERGLR